jgi:hypothetical protein
MTQQQDANAKAAEAEVPTQVAGAMAADIGHEQQMAHMEEEKDADDQRELAKMAVMSQIAPQGEASDKPN